MGVIEQKEQLSQLAQQLTLFSNSFMKVVFQDIKACEYVLRVLTGNDQLALKSVRTEYEISKVSSHDSRLDVLAEDIEGKLYNLELQRDSYLDHARRTRFYSSMVDSEMLQKGKDYSELPDLTIFYISEKDIWRGTYTIYDLMKTLNNSADDYEDGIRIVYVNASVNDNSEIARLMQYFKTADPNDKRFGPLSERVHFLKCEKEGVEIMCRIEEQIKEIGLEIGKEIGKEIGRDLAMKEVVVRMSKRGKSVSEIVDDTGVELDRAQMWMKEAMSAI